MVDPKDGWLVMGIQSVVVGFVSMMIAMGCASPQAPNGTGAESMVQTVSEITVMRDGEDSVVRLMGIQDPIYSVSMSEDGATTVVDLVGVEGPNATTLVDTVSDEGEQIAAYDGVVDLVSLSTFDDEDAGMPLTRIEIAMAGPGQADVTSTIDGLEIRIIPGAPEFDAVDAEDYAQDDVDEMAFSEPMLETDALDAAIAMPMATPPSATQLMGVSVHTATGGVLIGLQADGEIGSVEAFTLDDPARLVIDLPGLVAEGVPAKTSVPSEQVVAVRTAGHAGKVRVVVDGGSEAAGFQGRQIMPGATGLWVSIGSGDELAQTMTDEMSAAEATWLASLAPTEAEVEPVVDDSFDVEDPEPAAMETADLESEVAPLEDADSAEEMTPEVAPAMMETSGDLAQVYGLHYERTDELDRTAILTDGAVPYTTSAPDATTLVVSIPGAQISHEASDRIFPKAGGPISLIHAFQQPEVATPEVRVVFTRAPNQEPVLTRRGSMLFVDFQDLGVAAAPPPAFPDAGESDAVAQVASTSEASIDMTAEMAPEDMMQSEAGAGNSPDAPDALPGGLAMDMEMVETGGDGVEIVESLPSFEAGAGDMASAADFDTTAEVWVGDGVPAAVEVPAAIEVLEEGGLIDGKEYRGRRVSLDFKDVEIADVLRLIAEVSDLNIIAGDEVAGKVTIRLVETPWDQALDVVLMTKGLGFVRVGNVLRIAPADVLKAEEEVRLQERRNKEKLEDLEVKLLPVNYASVKDTEGLVKRLLSARGTVNLDTRTNTLIIKDISSVIDEASALIAAIDTQTPQVMIEAKIVEANLDFSRELGAVWSVQTQQYEDPLDPTTPRTISRENITFLGDNGLAFANPITSVPTGIASFGALILDEDFKIDAQIQAAESTGDGKVISSPRIVTLDNKEAKIEQGVSIPFQTFEGGDAKLEFIDAVLSLIVTPHITADESIIMEIEVTRNAPDDSVQTPTGSPAIAKNQAETETLVRDGQTLVLGGIYTIIKSKRQSRVPYLWRIPVIGNAFKSNEVTDARKELLVFVTPRIVRLPEMAQN
jgi:type IV pilus secretin PilQ/predicted competence protein